MRTKPQAHAIEALSQRLQPLFRGKHPGTQGGALADLTAIWLSGHLVAGDPQATARLRRQLLEVHLAGMWLLVKHYDDVRNSAH